MKNFSRGKTLQQQADLIARTTRYSRVMRRVMIENDTINAVATFLYQVDKKARHLKQNLNAIGITTREELGTAMHTLSLAAERNPDVGYPSDIEASVSIPYAPGTVYINPFYMLKDLSRWLCQCDRVDTRNEQLVILMRRYKRELEADILRASVKLRRAS